MPTKRGGNLQLVASGMTPVANMTFLSLKGYNMPPHKVTGQDIQVLKGLKLSLSL